MWQLYSHDNLPQGRSHIPASLKEPVSKPVDWPGYPRRIAPPSRAESPPSTPSAVRCIAPPETYR